MPEPREYQLCELEIRKRSTHIELFLKSSGIEDYFRAASSNSVNAGRGANPPFDVPRYNLPESVMGPLHELSIGTFGGWGRAELFVGGKVNLSFLLAQGLTAGVTFRLNTPVSPRLQREFVEKFDNGVGEFYDQFLRPEDIRANITVTEEMTSAR